METKRRAFGKGLEELFNTEQIDINKVEEKIIESTPKNEIVDLDLDQLRSNPYQPRKTFDEEALQELSNSIKEHGVFQPIIAKKSIKGYEIVAGERRVLASRMAGLDKIPAIVKDLTDEQMMEIALLENLQREDLNAMEEAMAYKRLQQELNLTQEELSKKVGKSRSHVTNMMGLLTLPEEVKDMIITKEISMGHARILSKLDDKEQIKKLADRMTGDLKDRPYMETLLKHIEEEEKVDIGKTAPYFRIRNTEGKDINRSDFKDKYLLIQFWASWDTISREKNAMFRRIYKKEQKNKNFALMGISLDLDREKWLEAVKQDTLKWEQTCEYSGWDGDVAKLFSIHTLPANILISPTGKIEGKNLDEKAIEDKLKEIAQKEKEK